MIKGAERVHAHHCSFAEERANRCTLEIPGDVFLDILYLSKEMGSCEWIGILEAEADKGVLTVKRLIIPPQEVTSTSAEFTGDLKRRPGMLYGCIHSHHNMKLETFSSTDREHAIGNGWDFQVVYTNSLAFTAEMINVMPCGMKASVPMEVETPVTEREVEKENIKKKEAKVENPPYSGRKAGQYASGRTSKWQYGPASGDRLEVGNLPGLGRDEDDVPWACQIYDYDCTICPYSKECVYCQGSLQDDSLVC
jgi:hypothetical protein